MGHTPPILTPVPEAFVFLAEKSDRGAFPNDFNVYLSSSSPISRRIAGGAGKARSPRTPATGSRDRAADLVLVAVQQHERVSVPVVACKADFEAASTPGFLHRCRGDARRPPASAATDPT